MWMGAAAAKQYSSAGFKREDQNGTGSDVGGENGHYGLPVGGDGGGGGISQGLHHQQQVADLKPAPDSLIPSSSGLSMGDYGASMSSATSHQPRKAHEGTSSAAAAAAAAAASLSSSTAYPYYSPYGAAGFAPKSSAALSTATARSPKQKARNTAGKKCSPQGNWESPQCFELTTGCMGRW